jgi:hypothetical protein
MASVDGRKHIIFWGGSKVGAAKREISGIVTSIDRENARSVPKSAARIGLYETLARLFVVAVVEAARFWGGQLFFFPFLHRMDEP